MNFLSLYRISFYLMLVTATLVLSIDATDSKIAMLYPVVAGAGAVAAFLTVDRRPGLGVSEGTGALLALLATGLTVLEYLFNRDLLLLALGHWLVYLQLVYMFREKTVSIDWWMFSLGLVQVLVGTVISQSDSVGLMLFLWAVLALWVLGLFSLQRDAGRARNLAGSHGERAEPYPGLLNAPFLFSAARVTLTTLALGGVIFLAMPRRQTQARTPRGQPAAQHLTGFDDEVQLGQMGEILESDAVVMSVELFDENDRRMSPDRISPDGEPLWRGVTMAIYENGRWYRQGKRPGSLPGSGTFPVIVPAAVRVPGPGRPQGVVRQLVKLEANDSAVLFGLRPMIEASTTGRFSPELNTIDGTISRLDTRPGSYDYEVRSFLDSEMPQAGEQVPTNNRRSVMLDLPAAIRSRFRELAERVIAERVPAESRNDVAARAKALEWFLRDSGQFSYTLKLDVTDRTIDPVEDFVFNRKEGHCEYFASALTLLLRSVGIPARMVNGFKGGDWNDLARVLSVRQKHAHSWVEAYLGELTPEGRERVPRWLTLDPTPGNERDNSVARVGGFKANFYQLTDLVRYVWVFYVVGYNAERQNQFLYAPIRELVREVRRGFRLMGERLTELYAWVRAQLHFPSVRSFFSARGFAVAFVGLTLIMVAMRLLAWLARRLLRRFFGAGDDADLLAAGAAHYRRLVQLLAGYGLERPPAETQEEFARRAGVFLTGQGSAAEAVADVPRVVVEAFYRVRFGNRELAAAELDGLEARLDALESTLRASQA